MMISQVDSKPDTTRGQRFGYLLAGLTSLLAITIFWLSDQIALRWVTQGLQFGAVLFCFISVYIISQIRTLHQMSYQIIGSELVIHHGRKKSHYSLNLAKIISPSEYSHVVRFTGLRWPGCFYGRGLIVTPNGESVDADFYATSPIQHQLLIQTAHTIVGLAPPDTQPFTEALKNQSTEISITENMVPIADLPSRGIDSPSAVTFQLPPLTLLSLSLNLFLWLGAGSALFLFRNSAPLPFPLGLTPQNGHSIIWLLIPLVGLIIYLTNQLLAARLQSQYPQLAKLLIRAALTVQIILLTIQSSLYLS